MFINQQIIFALINFGIIIGFCVYLWIRYGLPGIKAQMIQKEHDQELLHQEYTSLQKKRNRIAKLVVDEQNMVIDITSKIAKWRRIYEQQRRAEQQQQEQLQGEAEARRLEQARIHQQEVIEQKVLPRAIEQARTELGYIFAQETEGIRYIDTLIEQLEKSKS